MVGKKSAEAIVVQPTMQEQRQFIVVGTTPLIFNRMSEKVKRGLLVPQRRSRAELESRLKHDPLLEFRDSVYRDRSDDAPTRLVMPSTAFKKSLSQAGVDVPGAAKAKLLRLSYVVGYNVPIFGVPQLHMSVVRSADMNHTPDIRTRAIVPEWVALFTIRYVVPNLSATAITNLLASAGEIVGVGDFRQEKGAGDFGRFHLVNEDDAEATRIIEAGGREAQDAALENPEAFDDEAASLWAYAEEQKRLSGKSVAA